MPDRDKNSRDALAPPDPMATQTFRESLEKAIRYAVSIETTRRLGSLPRDVEDCAKIANDLSRALLDARQFETERCLESIVNLSLTKPEVIALFERTAAVLGKSWENDCQTFLDITIAMSRLQTVLRLYCEYLASGNPAETDTTVLIATVPGEAHLFAAGIMELTMRLQGWNTELFCPENNEELTDKLTDCSYDVICLSWSTSALTQTLAVLNDALGLLPSESRPIILAGGGAAQRKGKWLVRIGVDHVVDSTHGALDVVSQALHSRSKRQETPSARRSADRAGRAQS